jgi:cell division septum initiation protein DivIVA
MVSIEQVDQFIEKTERELDKFDKELESLSKELEKYEIPNDEEIVAEARSRLKAATAEAEREAGQKVAFMNDSIGKPSKPASPRRNRGLSV